MPQHNFYNIPANYQFIETLAHWIIENYKHKFSDLKIFLPNQRLSRKLKTYFQKLSHQDGDKTTFKYINNIKIKAISDLDIQDFCDYLPNKLSAQIIAEINVIKVVKKIDAIFLICQEIERDPRFNNPNFTQRYKIAKSLYDLCENLDIEQISVANLSMIDDANLPQHQQFGLDFFINFYSNIKNILLKNNIMFETQFHNFLCDKLIEIINSQNINQNIVIAGSTGSVLSSKKLIKAVKDYDKGAIFLYGYKPIKNYRQQDYPEIHPQFYLNETVKFINPDNKSELNPCDICNDKFLMAPNVRNDFSDLVFDNFENYENLLTKCTDLKAQDLRDITQNIAIIKANNELNEAKIISKICLEHLNKNHKIGIICNNQNLLQTLNLSLNNYNINYNNTISQSVLNSDFIIFLMLIFDIKFHAFNSYNFLSFIKHRYFKKIYRQENWQKFITEFEIKIIREDRISNDYDGLVNKVKNSKFANFIDEIYRHLPQDKSLKSLLSSCEYFANDDINSILSNSLAGKEIFEFLETLLAHNYRIENVEDLRTIFADLSYFEKSLESYNIDILSPIEARLLNYDLLIISAFNENDFPTIENHGWIGAKIKKELNINKARKKIGQNAYDFGNYLNNREIIITHSGNRLNSQKIESPFLTRLKTLCQLLSIDLDKSELYLKNSNDDIIFNKYFIAPPCPIPPMELLPKKYRITEIPKLLANPYALYVKKILKIEELKDIDYEPANAEFGTFAHEVLEKFVKDKNINSEAQLLEIFEKYFLAKTAKLIWYPRFKIFFAEFLKDNQQFLSHQNITELSISMDINNIQINGKIDRITIDEDNLLHIFDYKTGRIPSKKEVLSGLEPQLTIYAYIVAKNIFKDCNFAELSYWKLSRLEGSKISSVITKPQDIEKAIEATEKGLSDLLNYFHRDKNGFIATKDEDKDDIKNISRIAEWIN